jgi:hypothetical protein
MLPPTSNARKTLADIIFSKMETYDGEPGMTLDGEEVTDPTTVLDPRIMELYTKSVIGNRIIIYMYSSYAPSGSQSWACYARKRSSRQTNKNSTDSLTVGPLSQTYEPRAMEPLLLSDGHKSLYFLYET